MINFSYFSRDLKQDFSSFLFRNIYPFCSRPVNKFIRDLSFEIIKSGSLTISDIARTFNSNLNTVEKRLTIALGKYDLTSLIYHLQKHILDNLCNEPNRIIIDESDIIKHYGISFEDLSFVYDGSSSAKVKDKGYRVTGIVGQCVSNAIAPLYLDIYSSTSKNFKSSN